LNKKAIQKESNVAAHQRVSLADRNKNIKNFDEEFEESFNNSEQSSQMALNLIKQTRE
jgi:hypothetical protein